MLKLNMKISKNPIFQKLYELKDERYQAFSCKLVPNVAKEKILGVQIPKIKNLAKQFFGRKEAQNFVAELPHYYLEENIFHACLISQIKDFEKCAFYLLLPPLVYRPVFFQAVLCRKTTKKS